MDGKTANGKATGRLFSTNGKNNRKQRWLQRKFNLYHLKSFLWKLLRTLIIIGMTYVFLFPVLYMLSSAIRPASATADPTTVWVPKSFSLDSIKQAMKSMNYFSSIGRTLVVTIGSTLAAIVSSSLIGYGLARFRFKERNIIFLLVVATIIVPPQTIILSSFINFRYFDMFGLMKLMHSILPFIPESVNLINTPLTFILPSLFGTGLRSGLFIFIYRQFYIGIPVELEEAAEIDGCSPLKTFLMIIVPLAKSATITVFLFSFIWHWNDYYMSAMYFNQNMPISVMLNNMSSLLKEQQVFNGMISRDEMRTYIQAGCLLTIAPPLLFYTFTQKFFTESIERSGIVG